MSTPTIQTATPVDPTDASLVSQALGGDLAAFEMLVGRYDRLIYTLALRITGSVEDAQDVTQDTFVSVLEHLQGFRGESSFSTWIRRIATHAALKVLRKRRGLPRVSLEAATEPQEGYDTVPHPEYIADWSQSPQELLHRAETGRIIQSALESLDDKHRLVFLLRDVEGFSVRETAEALGLSEVNVKVRLLRARLQLREELTRLFGDPKRRVEPQSHDHE